jgi:CBS domain-containing protein
MDAPRPSELSLFRHRVRDLIRRPPVGCGPDTPIVDVARRMLREGVGSMLVTADDGTPLGIITDRDLRAKVVAEGRDAGGTRAAQIMSSPLVTIGPAAFAFEAVLEMTRRAIHHLVVLEEGRARGVLSSYDFMALQAAHPAGLTRDITRAGSLPELAGHASQVTGLVRRLVDEGGTAYDVGQLVSELNDRVVRRVLDLTAGALEAAGDPAPPVPFCWLVFGSEGRREQTLRTDQDNGLVYADPPAELAARASAYYARFATGVVQGLQSVGYPLCEGGFMASNPQWCRPLGSWRGLLAGWMDNPSPEKVLGACIVFDLRPLDGATELAVALRDVLAEAPRHRTFLRLMARDVADRRVPLTIFGNVAVQRRGPRRGRVDVKAAGSMQLVGAGRVHALELGVEATNTVDRFREAGRHGIYKDEEVREITDAHQHLTRLRLVHQLGQLTRGEVPDNFVDPRTLSHADALLFRDALKTVTRVQAGIRERFATDLVPS